MENEMLNIVAPQESYIVTEHPFREYDHLRITLGDELNAARESFVKIGYLLKVARDSDILKNSRYNTYLEFAQEEFNLDASTVSRFIGINDRFSINHNSPEMDPKYKGFGRAKLQEMLTLPDYLTEALEPEMSKSEIKAIKEEYEEEQRITPLEVMAEPDQRRDETNIERFMYELLKKNKDLYEGLFRKYRDAVDKDKMKFISLDFAEWMCPCDDFKIWVCRPAGLGKCQLKVPENEPASELTSLRGDFKEEISDTELIMAILKQFPEGITSVRAAYETRYGELWEDPDAKPEIAPVQEKPKAPEKKKSRVSVTKDKPKKEAPAKSGTKEPAKPHKDQAGEDPKEPCMGDNGDLSTAPMASDNQPDPIPEEKAEAPEDDMTAYLKEIRGFDDAGIFTELTLNTGQLDANVKMMNREGKSISYEAAVKQNRKITCLLSEIEWRWNAKTEQEETR